MAKEIGEIYSDVEIGDVVFRLFVSISSGFGVCAAELHEVGGGVLQLLLDEG